MRPSLFLGLRTFPSKMASTENLSGPGNNEISLGDVFKFSCCSDGTDINITDYVYHGMLRLSSEATKDLGCFHAVHS